MSFAERIGRITERHEALARTVELIALSLRDVITAIDRNSENIGRLLRIAEGHENALAGWKTAPAKSASDL